MSVPDSTAIIFDLDDTLFDEVDFLHSSYTVIASSLAGLYPSLSAKDMVEVMETAEGNAFDALRDWLPAEVGQDQLWMRDVYRAHYPTINLRPGVAEALSQLVDRNHPLGLITDGRIVTQSNKIKALNLERWIPRDHIIISEAIGSDKLSPLPFQIMQQLIPEAHRFVYIGDNPAKDITRPRQLGWTTVQITDIGRNIHSQPSIPVPDFKITSFSELTALFD